MDTDLLVSILVPMADPLAILLIGLLVFRRADAVVQPIVVNVVNGLAKQASTNALTYGLMIGYGLSASLQALADQATILHWLVIAALAKVCSPFITAMLAFAAKNDLGGSAKSVTPSPTGTTTPPFAAPVTDSAAQRPPGQ